MLGQPASSQTVCSPSRRTRPLSSVYSGPIRPRVLIHDGLRSIGVCALRTSSRSIRRPSGWIPACDTVTRLSLRRARRAGRSTASRFHPVDLRIFTEPQQGASYDQLLRLARASEDAGFDGFFRSDHYLAMGDVDGLPGPTDAWITLAGLARETAPDPARHDGHRGHLPAAGRARDLRRPDRRDEWWPDRAWHRCRLVRGGAPGVRDPVPVETGALRPARGAARDPGRAVGDAGRLDVLVRGDPLPARGLSGAAQAGPAAGSSGDHRG